MFSSVGCCRSSRWRSQRRGHRPRDGRLDAVLVVDLALHDAAVVTGGHADVPPRHAIDREERRAQVGAGAVDLERHHVGLLRGPLQPRRRVDGEQASVVDDRDPLADQRGLREDVGAQQHRVVFAEGADDLTGLLDLPGIEPGRRLVQQQYLG